MTVTVLDDRRREYARAGIPACLVIDVRHEPTMGLFEESLGDDYADAAVSDHVVLHLGGHSYELHARDLII